MVLAGYGGWRFNEFFPVYITVLSPWGTEEGSFFPGHIQGMGFSKLILEVSQIKYHVS